MQQSLGRCEPCFLRAHWKSGYLRSGPGPCVLFPFFVRHPRNGSVAEALELKVDVGFQAMAVLLAVAGPQPKIQGAGPAPNPEAASAHFDGSLGAHRQGRCGAKCQFCLGSGSKFVGLALQVQTETLQHPPQMGQVEARQGGFGPLRPSASGGDHHATTGAEDLHK